MKRLRRRTCIITIFTVLGSCFIQFSTSEEVSFRDYPGKQYTSQECAIQRQRKRKVTVTGVSLVCDSSQNDDETSYQNSLTCRPGDQAKAAVSFNTRRMGSSSTIFIDVTSRALGKLQWVHNTTNICNMANLMYWGDDETVGDDIYASAQSNACPLHDGSYTFIATFTIPSYTRDTDFVFTPALRVDFYEEDRKQIGCVETGTLAEVAFRKNRQRQGQRFFVMSFLVFGFISALCLLGHRRKRKEGEQANMKRQASMMRRFHYVQTTHSGEASPPLSSSDSGSFSYGNSERPSSLPPTIREVE